MAKKYLDLTGLSHFVEKIKGLLTDKADIDLSNVENKETARTNIGAAATSHTHSAEDINSGTLSIARGGTGAATEEAARTNLGAAADDLSNVEDSVFLEKATSAGAGGVQIVEATSTDGIAYTATASGITELKAGITINLIPGRTSASTMPNLNLNGLGAKNIKLRISSSTSLTTQASSENWMVANKPINLIYDGTQWVTSAPRPAADDIWGEVSVAHGGTGAETAAEARTNLGAASKEFADSVAHPHLTADGFVVTVPHITALNVGESFVMVPHEDSGLFPTINVNGLGAKAVYNKITNGNKSRIAALDVNKFYRLTYDGEVWVTDVTYTAAENLIGTMPVNHGGTGAVTAMGARENLGVPGWEEFNEGKGRPARFLVAAIGSGWTNDQADYMCDGYNDEEQINAAIAALPATGGEVVILDGTYNIQGKILVNKPNVTISGNGRSTILKRKLNGSLDFTALISVTSTHCTIRDLILDGNKAEYSSSYNRGISIGEGAENIVAGNIIKNNSSYAIYIYKGSNHKIIGNTIDTNGNDGINISQGYNHIISENDITSNTGSGIYSISGGSLVVSNNNIIGNSGRGIYCNDSYSAITGNISRNNSLSGIRVNGTNNVITGNVCISNNSIGIEISSSSLYGYNTITGNVSNQNVTGISAQGSQGNTIAGNTCYNNIGTGINILSDAHRNLISGNSCYVGNGSSSDYSSTQYTISVNSMYNLIVGNNIMGKNYTNGGTGNTFADNKYTA